MKRVMVTIIYACNEKVTDNIREDVFGPIIDGLSANHPDELVLSHRIEDMPDVTFSIPVVCETKGCRLQGTEINRVSGIETLENANAMLEDTKQEWGKCTGCEKRGTALDPEPST